MANDSFPILNLIWSILCLMFTILTFIYHSFKLVSKHGFRKKMKVLSIFSLLMIGTALIGITVFVVTELITENTNNVSVCIFASHWGPTGYSIFKFIMYYILVLRFTVTFKNSAVQYSNNKLNIWVFVLLIWTIANVIATNFTATNVEGKCEVAIPPLPLLASISNVDLVACVVNTVLFSRPLLQLQKQRDIANASGSRRKGVNFKRLAVKQCILSLIAAMSTIVSLLFVAMFNMYTIFITLDYVVSTSCIILMYSWNKRIIDKMCCKSTAKIGDSELTATPTPHTPKTEQTEARIATHKKPSMVLQSNSQSSKHKSKKKEMSVVLIEANVAANPKDFEQINVSSKGNNSMPDLFKELSIGCLQLNNTKSQPTPSSPTYQY